MQVGVILGSGYDEFLDVGKSFQVRTSYGEVEARELKIGEIKTFILNRHGKEAATPANKINHKANIAALQQLGVERIIALSTVGSMHRSIKVGDLVLLDQFIDLSSWSISFEDKYFDVSEPFCEELRSIILKSARALELKLHPRGTYICVRGPRYETKAEIKAYQKLGGEVVGMTIAPECTLAREINICYAAVSLVTNFAAGLGKAKLSHQKVLEVCSQKRKNLEKLILKVIPEIPMDKKCKCS
ncbi:MAG: MTAP family purine nucleoside phosphorylase [Methanocellales archaeon]